MVQLNPVFQIYLISNLKNGKVYVGRTRRTLDLRWKEHLYDSKVKNFHFSKAIRKYGAENFKIRILRRTHDMREAYELETQYILLTKSYDHEHGYNSTFGGDGAGIATLETRVKMSESRTGPKHYYWGKHRSSETKKKLRVANLGGNSPVFRCDLNGEKIAKMYAENKSLRYIGKIFHADSHTIADRLESMGIPRRDNWLKFSRKPRSQDRRFKSFVKK